MQTRKRAKSISFGKKPKEKVEDKEQDVVLHATEDETPVKKVETPEETPKVVEAKEAEHEAGHKGVEHKEAPKEEEIEPEALDEKKEDEEPVVVTPQEDFLTDASPAAEDDEPKEVIKEEEKDAEKEEVKDEPVSDNILSDNLSSVPESVSPEPTLEEKKDADADDSAIAQPVVVDHNDQPKDDTAGPQSAFSLQGGDEKVESSSDDGKKKFGLYFFIVALLSFILGLGAMAAVTYFGLLDISLPKQLPFGNISLNSLPGAQATPTPAPKKPTAVPATPTPEVVDKTEFTISVLNGSGISGRAATVQSDLTRAGFTVATTGNADSSTYTTTLISVKQKVSDGYVAALQKELEKEYTLGKVTKVPDTSTAQTTDVVVILGSQAAN